MQNHGWKTTVIGVLLALCYYISAVHPEEFPIQIVHFANYCVMVGFLVFGVSSKDKNLNSLIGLVTGNTKPLSIVGEQKEDNK